MYKRVYYLNGNEIKLETLMKYIEISLTHGFKQLDELCVSFIDKKITKKEVNDEI